MLAIFVLWLSIDEALQAFFIVIRPRDGKMVVDALTVSTGFFTNCV